MFLMEFLLGISVLHHAIDSKNLDTIMVIVRQFDADENLSTKNFEMNLQVGIHKWTPLYRAGQLQLNIPNKRISFFQSSDP